MRSISVMVLGHGKSRVGTALVIQHDLRRWFDLCRNNFFLRGSDGIAPASLDSPALSAQESERFALHRHRYGIAFERRNWGTDRLTGRDGARPDRIRGRSQIWRAVANIQLDETARCKAHRSLCCISSRPKLRRAIPLVESLVRCATRSESRRLFLPPRPGMLRFELSN